MEKALEALLMGTEKGDEPGENLDEILQKGDDSKPNIGAMNITSAGYTIVYDTLTGVDSKVNSSEHRLRAILLKKRKDGTPVFSLKRTVIPVQGVYKCLLHIDDPNRERYDTIGFATCPKDNLNSTYQVRRHMLKKHKVEWEAIEQEREEAEKKEDRDFQREMMTRAMAPKVEAAPLYVSKKDSK